MLNVCQHVMLSKFGGVVILDLRRTGRLVVPIRGAGATLAFPFPTSASEPPDGGDEYWPAYRKRRCPAPADDETAPTSSLCPLVNVTSSPSWLSRARRAAAALAVCQESRPARLPRSAKLAGNDVVVVVGADRLWEKAGDLMMC